ncbi:hypothetical protein G5714_007531 [Onychostoma macrolepis]|uniref:Ig-like domain-containing protein n=1 Tax=Onychostoma macrolepis TaxID=369639 RepID=A0A7J6CTA6_9TELE|nr:hypothetical protein G5714_007531 [Onychostoma macrolepis]
MIGAEVTHVFCSSGENVRLSCNNALSGCTSTTWIYSRHSVAVELITGGIKKKYIEGHERLSLGSDCSLNIKKVTKEDCRLYSCRQYVNEEQQVTDARVYLHVLHVSSSSSQSEIRSGRSVTLSCQLYYDRVSCDTLVGSEGIDLIWVNQAGVNLQTDSRFQIFSSEQCLSSLTTTLLNEDHNREWRCQVTQRNQLKTSATYTVKYSAPTETKTPSPVTSSTSAAAPTQPASTTAATQNQVTTLNSLIRVIVIIVEITVFAAPTVILLQIICVRRAGSSGVDDTHVFCSSGENVRLSCNNALPGCTSTTWSYSRHSETVELITGGIKKKDTERHERLSLGSDCSLNIKNVTKEDRGLYSCRQYVNGVQQGTDAHVYLHVLHVSSSSSQSEIRSGRSVTLSCQLYYDQVSCDTLVGSEGIDLIWVNQAGVNLQTDSRFQIFSSEQCLSSLTTTLLNEDHNREWRCQVTQRNQLKTSATYTVQYSGVKDSTLIPVSSSNSEKSSQTTAAPTTRDNRRGTNDSVFTDKNNGASDSVSRSIHLTPSTNEHKDDVTYTEVATHCTIQARKKEVYDDDKVTYSSIRGATAGPQDDCSQLYASVNKNHHK